MMARFQIHGSQISTNSITPTFISPSHGSCWSFTNTYLCKSNLKEENFLDTSKILDDASIVQEQSRTQDPGRPSQERADDGRHYPYLRQLPLNRGSRIWGIIVCNGDGTKVGKERDEYNEIRADSLIEYDHGQCQVDLKVQAKGDAIHDVCCRCEMYKNQGSWRGRNSIPFMRWKICLATFMAVMIVERPSSRKTTSLKENTTVRPTYV